MLRNKKYLASLGNISINNLSVEIYQLKNGDLFLRAEELDSFTNKHTVVKNEYGDKCQAVITKEKFNEKFGENKAIGDQKIFWEACRFLDVNI